MENLCIVNGPEEIDYTIKCMHACTCKIIFYLESVKFYNSGMYSVVGTIYNTYKFRCGFHVDAHTIQYSKRKYKCIHFDERLEGEY